MTGHNPTWFRRHGRAILIVFATGAVVAVGFALATAIERVRTSANPLADS